MEQETRNLVHPLFGKFDTSCTFYLRAGRSMNNILHQFSLIFSYMAYMVQLLIA